MQWVLCAFGFGQMFVDVAMVDLGIVLLGHLVALEHPALVVVGFVVPRFGHEDGTYHAAVFAKHKIHFARTIRRQLLAFARGFVYALLALVVLVVGLVDVDNKHTVHDAVFL